MGEVIRRGFEEVFENCTWSEEFDAVGNWPPLVAKRHFGSERPSQEIFRTKPYIPYAFGLFTGTVLRWYVEGATEYHAVLHAFPDPAAFGIELLNLRADFSIGGVPLRLNDLVQDDVRHRRFSMISFDADRKDHQKIIKALSPNIVGHVACQEPDFEFANFDLEELIEIAARLDDSFQGLSDDR